MMAIKASASDVSYQEIVVAAAEVVRQNEGSYASVNPDDNGALSIGWLQWHGNRALSLLKTIIAADTASASSILGNTLYNEITTASDWSTRILTEGERTKISALISTSQGMAAQDSLAQNDLSIYISHGIALGITDPAALVYYADLENQCGSGGAKRVGNAAINTAGSGANVDLDVLHSAALADSVAGRYETRRIKTYTNCLLLGWGNTSSTFEVWNILAARNVREEADTSSALVTTVYAGDKVVVTEKIPMNGETRAKTTLGWLTLNNASGAINPELSTKTVAAPVVFKLDEGTFCPDPVASTTANGINTSRTADSIILYDNNYSHSAPQTNAYGTEVAVDVSGKVLNDPRYGLSNTTIPEGGFVLSGIGTGYSWIMANVAKDKYIDFDDKTMTICVYSDRESFNSSAAKRGIVTSLNTSRPANSLVVYDKTYTQSTTPTNEYGTEVAVDSNGRVLNAPSYGICKTQIPEGGFVISGIGTGYRWMQNAVSQGSYVYFDRDSLTIRVYQNKNAYFKNHKATYYNTQIGELPAPTKQGFSFAGWVDENGQSITFSTICDTGLCKTLTAQWSRTREQSLIFNTDGGEITDTLSKAVDGVNVYRGTDKIIIYDNDKGATTGTNIYGAEAVVDSNGCVTKINPYGYGNSAIPEGGFVISGNGAGSTWITSNISVGSKVVFYSSTSTILICKNDNVYNMLTRTRLYGERLGTLPTAEKDGYNFIGWYTEDGSAVTEDTVMSSTVMTLYARWQIRPGALTFDVNGGNIRGLISTTTIAGTNIPRANNTIVLYKDRATTGTNAYGAEVLVGRDGIVDAVYPYGSGDIMIPEGSFALSGIGSGYTWIRQNVSVGNYVSLSSGTVSVWADKHAYDAGQSTTVTCGERYPTLPVAEKEGYKFAGWLDESGSLVTNESTVTSTHGVTLTAKWEKLCAVYFEEKGGKIVTEAVLAVASGINVPRSSNSLVIYAGKETTGTNTYGSEAVVDQNGIVTAVYPYGRGNNRIPDGSVILSGNGTMHTWIQNNVKVGNYVRIKGYNVYVYANRNAYDAEDGKLFVNRGDSLGCLPKVLKGDMTFAGWMSGKTVYTKDTKIYSFTSLYATWQRTSATLIFDTQGGSINGAVAVAPVNSINTSRPANSLVIYDKDYGLKTYTNPYGTEIAVNAKGRVITSPVYGACQLDIPEDGFVLSGIGTMYSWLSANVKEGYYVSFEPKNMTVSVYKTEGDLLASKGKSIRVGQPYGALPTPEKEGYIFTGWSDHNGNTVTENTVVESCDVPVLTARWQQLARITFDADSATFTSACATLSGTNIPRSTNALVLYHSKNTTGTNVYGSEAVIDSNGMVIYAQGYGRGDSIIPEGGFVLSGNGTMSDWITQNLKVGAYVTVSENTVTVYENKASYDAAMNGYVDIPAGSALTELPVPFLAGYTFDGWYVGEERLTTETVIRSDVTASPRWS